MKPFVFRHTVGFEETNLVGNVYFTNYLLWQGHCHELFLGEFAPDVVKSLMSGEIAFLTKRCSCEYLGDQGFSALDRVYLEMCLLAFRGGRMTLSFEYFSGECSGELMARGEQEIYCKIRRGEQWVPDVFPAQLVEALLSFADEGKLQESLKEAIGFKEARQAASRAENGSANWWTPRSLAA